MKSQKEICPASYFEGLEGGKIHYASRQEIQCNGGVCKKCRCKFSKKHSKSINGNFSNSISEPEHRQHRRYDEEGGYADTRFEGSYEEFDFEKLEHAQVENEAINFAAKAISKFALRLLEKGSTPQRIWTTINAICFASHIHPSQAETMDWFAKKLGMTKANFSLEVNHWRDLLNLPITGGGKKKRVASIESAKASHEKRGHIMNGSTFSDTLFQSINRATEQSNKNSERIRCMTPERRQELIDRLKPLCDLKTRLERSSAQIEAVKTPP